MAKVLVSADPAQLLNWVERVASFFAEHYGFPPITGRILGWLLVCDPVEQSAAEIVEAIGASRASLTTNLQILNASGLVRRLTRPGRRTTYYRIDDDMWATVIKRRIQSMMSFSRITADGLSLVGPDSPRAARLRAAHVFFDWMAVLLAKSKGPRAPRRK
jgi:DNA-binding transcriptional ArsR family regulator